MTYTLCIYDITMCGWKLFHYQDPKNKTPDGPIK